MFGRFRSRSGYTLVELMIVVAIVAILLALVISLLGNGCGSVNTVKSVIARYTIEGTVVAVPGAKMRMGEGTETKFGINLDTNEGPRIVNCSSTQCASLVPGNRVSFSCFEEVHAFEPNEEECRFDKLLANVPVGPN